MNVVDRQVELTPQLRSKLIDMAWKELEKTELSVADRAEVMICTLVSASACMIAAYASSCEKTNEVKEKLLDICIDLLKKETENALQVFTKKEGEHGKEKSDR